VVIPGLLLPSSKELALWPGVGGSKQPGNNPGSLARKSSFIKRLETIRVAWKSKSVNPAR
jgi:hypothetical protein